MRILAVTGTRADWGLLLPVLIRLRDDARFDLRLCATGQHLDPRSPSLEAIRTDGFEPDHQIDIQVGEDDSSAAIAKSMGLCSTGIGSVLEKESPDLIMVLGDRYEMLAAVGAALVARIPVAHLCGGDLTHGAFDDAIRHAITKMSSIHFVTNEDAARRVRQMGEPADRVIVSGSPGIDRLMAEPIMSRQALVSELGLPEDKPFVLISFHPETLAPEPSAQLDALLEALKQCKDLALLLSGSNADPGARAIDRAFEAMASSRRDAVYFSSLGSRRYLSAMNHAAALVGNSSSGLYEAPSFGTPTVNIGDRQAGRLQATSVFDCTADRGAILTALQAALAWAENAERTPVRNPYGDGHAAERIVDALAGIDDPPKLIRKSFEEFAA